MPRLTTIFVLLDALTVRADVRVHRRRVEVANLVRAAREQQDEAVDVIERLAAGRLAGGVLVLTDAVFLQTLDLPPRAIAGLGARELENALAYEAQSFTGLTVTDTDLAWHREGEERQFLVLQAGRTDLAMIQEAIARAGGTLLAVAHPAGVPLSLADATADSFHRLEHWGGLRADVRADAGRVRVHVMRGEGPPPGSGLSEQLIASGGGVAAPAADSVQRFELARDSDLTAWLGAWARAQTARHPSVVAWRPPEPAAARTRRFVLAGVLLLGTVFAAVLDREQLHREQVATNARLTATRAPLDRLAAKEREIANLTRQLDEARTQPLPRPADASAWSAAVAVAALEALAAERPVGLVVDEVTLGWRRCALRGRAHTSRTVDELASGLAPRLALLGYHVVPGTRRQVETDAGTLFEFTLDIVETALASRASAAGSVSEEPR